MMGKLKCGSSTSCTSSSASDYVVRRKFSALVDMQASTMQCTGGSDVVQFFLLTSLRTVKFLDLSPSSEPICHQGRYSSDCAMRGLD